MLLSFAQFEREVTERIRDKIGASKRKGMWMGGPVPLGYEPNGRSLTINESEPQTVRTLFQLYLEHGTVRKLKQEADRQGLLSKLRPDAKGRIRGGRPFSRGHLYHLLKSPIYTGRVGHNAESFEGQHPDYRSEHLGCSPSSIGREHARAILREASHAANASERKAVRRNGCAADTESRDEVRSPLPLLPLARGDQRIGPESKKGAASSVALARARD